MSKHMTNEYAIYRGENLLAIGTATDCARELKVSEKYIYWLISPTAKKRLASRKNLNRCIVGVKLDDEDE